MIRFPCDNQPLDAKACENGIIMYYGCMPCPPRFVKCSKCLGTGFISVDDKFISDKIAELESEISDAHIEIQSIQEEIAKLQSYKHDV